MYLYVFSFGLMRHFSLLVLMAFKCDFTVYVFTALLALVKAQNWDINVV